MDDLLKPVKTVRSNIESFETLSLADSPRVEENSAPLRRPSKIQELEVGEVKKPLQAKSTTTAAARKHPAVVEVVSTNVGPEELDSISRGSQKVPTISSVDEVLSLLKGQPDFDTLRSCLEYLQDGHTGSHTFNVKVPGPLAAQVIHRIVTLILPSYWATINSLAATSSSRRVKQLLLECLRSVSGIGSLLAVLKGLKLSKDVKGNVRLARDTIECLAQLIEPKSFVLKVIRDTIAFNDKESQQHLIWKDFISTIVGGKLHSTVSEAAFATKCLDDGGNKDSWIVQGGEYASWLGRNLNHILVNLPLSNSKEWNMMARLVKRCMSIAHSDLLITEVLDGLVFHDKAMWTPLAFLLSQLHSADQQAFFKLVLNCVCNRYFVPSISPSEFEKTKTIGGVGTIIAGIIGISTRLEDILISWISSSEVDSGLTNINANRAMIVAVAGKQEKLKEILDRAMSAFGDKLYIQHKSLLQQEVLAKIILLSVGYLYRLDKSSISGISKSGLYLRVVSNRLASSLPRARLLGMIVGTSISRLVESPDKALKFDVDELELADSKQIMDLVNVCDDLYPISVLREVSTTPKETRSSRKRKLANQKIAGDTPKILGKKVIAIENLSDDAESDDGLISYQKPDEDAEDSEEDPTMINRSKPIAPVYIKDLVACLLADDKPEAVELALKTAPSLIRRKANFGTELAENISRLASTLVNLQEAMDKREYQILRLQAMIACVVSQPSKMAPWFATFYFEADISQAQRATILTTLGLSSRELGGYNDALQDISQLDKAEDFPSQKLNPKLANIYGDRSNAVNSITSASGMNAVASSISRKTLQPMALAAADKLSGPDVLKVRTFSSRMAVEKKTQAAQQARQKRVPKDLHLLLSYHFYLALCQPLTIVVANSSISQNLSTSLLDPSILRLTLQTLTIILSTLGPHAASLNELTRETLLLLTSMHNATVSCDPYVLPTLLNLFLLILDLNISAGAIAEERLVTDFGKEVSELVTWASDLGTYVSIPENAGGSAEEGDDSDGEMPWTVVAAGIQVKWAEIGRKFQGRLLGLGPNDF